MGKLAKQQRRALQRRVRDWQLSVGERAPPWARRFVAPVVHYAELLLIDHGVFRLFYLNRHRIAEGAWRSAQPAPHDITRLARDGIRTIVNLRGQRQGGTYWLEEAACARHGIRLIDFQVRSRAAPTLAELRGARDLFERLDEPFLMHCKSGADRAGLMSVLYLVMKRGVPVEQAIGQLSLKFGHFRQAETGILDYFFERYMADNARAPIAFMDWVERVYDPQELKQAFAAKGWANVIVNKILRRE